MEENNNVVVQKNNKKIIIGYILMAVVILGLVGYIVWDKGVFNNFFNNTNLVKPNNDINETNKEVDVTDSSLIMNITEKVNIITDADVAIDEDYLNHLYIDTKLSDSDKLNRVLNLTIKNAKNTDVISSYDTIKNSEFKKIVQNAEELAVYRLGEIRVSDVNSNYKSLFNETPKNQNISGCPRMFYDKDNTTISNDGSYYVMYECGGISGYNVYKYVNNITQDNDHVYVYLSVGMRGFDEDPITNGTVNIYYDYERKKKIDTISVDVDFKIDSSNYDKFSEYKIVFNKANNNYYYDSIERVK